jgi:tetratricopeptide (TPR) repeat protein
LLFLAIIAGYLYITGYFDMPVKPGTPEQKISETSELQHSQSSGQRQENLFELQDLPTPLLDHHEHKQAAKGLSEAELKAVEKLKEGDYEGAIKYLKELSEKDKRVLADIGLLYIKLTDYDNGITFLEEALKQETLKHTDNELLTRKALAFAYYKKDDLDKSLLNIEKCLAIKKEPELLAIHDRLMREKSTQQGFIGESTMHFKVMFDGYEHSGISRMVIGILEDAYKHVGSELNYFPSQPVTVILYTTKAFHDTTHAPEWAGGLYDGKIRVPVKGVEGNEEILKKVLFHEYTHAVVHSITPVCPLWVNEGLAEYFSKKYPKRIGQVVPLNLLERSFSWLGGGRVGIAYWESYSAVSFLIEKYSASNIKDFLYSLAKGNDINTAFSDAFYTSYNDFIASWGKG